MAVLSGGRGGSYGFKSVVLTWKHRKSERRTGSFCVTMSLQVSLTPPSGRQALLWGRPGQPAPASPRAPDADPLKGMPI